MYGYGSPPPLELYQQGARMDRIALSEIDVSQDESVRGFNFNVTRLEVR